MNIEIAVDEVTFFGRSSGLSDTMGSIDGRLSIAVGGKLLFSEEMPVLELAHNLCRWARDGLADAQDFEFESMSLEETDWFWIRRYGDGWRVGSRWQDWPCTIVLSDLEVVGLVDRLRLLVRDVVDRELALDISWIVGLPALRLDGQ